MFYILLFVLIFLIVSFMFYSKEYNKLTNNHPAKKEIYLLLIIHIIGIVLVIILIAIYFLK